MKDPNEKRPGYKKTKVGWIPKDWRESLAGNICKTITKGTTPKSRGCKIHDPIPYLRVQNLMFDGTLEFGVDPLFVERRTHESELTRSKVFPGDVLINIVGPPLGKVSRVPSQYPEWNINQAIAVFRLKDAADSRYFSLFLQSNRALVWLESQAKKTSGQKNLTLETCQNLPIPLPPLPEQQKIAEILSTWDDAIEQTAALIESKRQQKKALMQQLLTGHRRLPGFVGEWRRLLLRDTFGKELMIEKGAPLTAASLLPGSIPVVAGGQSYAYYHKFHTHTDPCITISASGAYAGYVWLHEQPIWASDCNVLTSKGADLHYIFHLLQFRQPEVYRLQTGGAQPHVYSRDLGRLILSLPELPEQRAIAAVLDAADKEIVSLEAKLEALRQQKKGLMQRLLTGQVRVKV